MVPSATTMKGARPVLHASRSTRTVSNAARSVIASTSAAAGGLGT